MGMKRTLFLGGHLHLQAHSVDDSFGTPVSVPNVDQGRIDYHRMIFSDPTEIGGKVKLWHLYVANEYIATATHSTRLEILERITFYGIKPDVESFDIGNLIEKDLVPVRPEPKKAMFNGGVFVNHPMELEIEAGFMEAVSTTLSLIELPAAQEAARLAALHRRIDVRNPKDLIEKITPIHHLIEKIVLDPKLQAGDRVSALLIKSQMETIVYNLSE